MADIRDIDIQEWKYLKISTLGNVEEFLKSTEILLEHNIGENKIYFSTYPWIAAELYTFAIEEFGKLLILLSCQKFKNVIKLDYSQARFASLDKNIIEPLENEWGFIEIEKIGRNRWIKITQEGIDASEFLI